MVPLVRLAARNARTVRATLLSLLLALSALLPLLNVSAPVQAYAAHGPILLEGEAGLCTGLDDGIVNCDEADGSPENPYVIAGWHIVVPDDAACDSAGKFPALGDLMECTELPACASGTAVAAVSLCSINASVVLRDLRVEIAHRQATPAVVIDESPRVRIEDATIIAAGATLRVQASGGAHHEVVITRSVLAAAEGTEVTAQPLIGVAGGWLSVEESTLTATGRVAGIEMEGRSIETDRLTFRNSTLRGALQRGIEAFDVGATIHGSTFLDIGQNGWGTTVRDPTTGASLYHDGSSVVYLAVGEQGYSFDQNWVEVRGVGLNVAGTGAGRIESNRFVREEGSPPLWPVAVRFADEACATRAWYNGLDGRMRIVQGSDAPDCSLDARHTWWGQASGPNVTSLMPQVDGHVLYDPWLRVPLEELPSVIVEGPEPGSRHARHVVLEGTSKGSQGHPVEAVQALVGGNWSEGVIAEGTDPWRVDFDLDAYPFGALTIQVRACGEEDCGAPVARTIVHAAPPSPPVAVLAAYPRVPVSGLPVLLDGSASYATDTFPVTSYRFDFGDGRGSDWQGDPSLEVAYASAGRYTAALEVRDETGTASMNRAIVLLHVRGPSGLDAAEVGHAAALPAVAAVAAVLGAAAFVGVRQRR